MKILGHDPAQNEVGFTSAGQFSSEWQGTRRSVGAVERHEHRTVERRTVERRILRRVAQTVSADDAGRTGVIIDRVFSD